jgi:predicted CopG family antitoxin
MSTVIFMAKKTTITLRDDVYQALAETSGPRNISNNVNKILIEFFAKKESMFASMKQTDLADLRDHHDRCP